MYLPKVYLQLDFCFKSKVDGSSSPITLRGAIKVSNVEDSVADKPSATLSSNQT
jgi:hypothetical protein